MLLGLPIGVALFTFAVTMLSLGAGLLVTFLGVPVLAAGLAACRGFGSLERARARGLLGLEVGEPEPLRAPRSGVMAWMGAVLKSGTSWRNLLYAVVQFPWAVFSFVVTVTFWVARLGHADVPAVVLGLPDVRRPGRHPAVRRRARTASTSTTPSRSP